MLAGGGTWGVTAGQLEKYVTLAFSQEKMPCLAEPTGLLVPGFGVKLDLYSRARESVLGCKTLATKLYLSIFIGKMEPTKVCTI